MSTHEQPHSLAPFYESGVLPFEERMCKVPASTVLPTDLLRTTSFDPEEVSEKVAALSTQNTPVESSGYMFERRMLQVENPKGTVHFWSTKNAGGRTNPPNLVDSALYAITAERNGLNFTYWALPGNSETSGMNAQERKLYSRTGSMLVSDDEGIVSPMDYTEAWADAVAEVDSFGDIHLFGKGHGGIVATAIGVALRQENVKSTLQIERPGLIDSSNTQRISAQTKDELRSERGVDYDPDDEFGPHRNAALLKRSVAPGFKRPAWHLIDDPLMVLAHTRAEKHGLATDGMIQRDLTAFREAHEKAAILLAAPGKDISTAHTAEQLQMIRRKLLAAVPIGGIIGYSVLPGTRKAISRAPQVVAALMDESIRLSA